MKLSFIKQVGQVALVGCVAILVSCGGGGGSSSGGGGGGTDVEGLEIAKQLSLAEASDAASSSSVSARTGSLNRVLGVGPSYAVPTTGDYVTDEVSTHVFEESMNVLEMINEIMCFFGQTGYADMVNRGNYVALVDANKCDNHDSQSDSEGSQSQTGATADYERWILNSSRDNDSAPHIVTGWVELAAEDDINPGGTIEFLMEIEQAADENNKFGVFSLDFEEVGSEGSILFSGNLSASLTDDGRVQVQMRDEEVQGEPFTEQVNAIIDGEAGVAYAQRTFPEDFFGGEMDDEGDEGEMDEEGDDEGDDEEGSGELITETVNVAYDNRFYLAGFVDEDGAERSRCLDRDDFTENVWRYGLYRENGDRLELNGGFGIKFDDNQYGWAGYYGVWGGPDVTIENGVIVTDDNDETTIYTVFVGEGRLIRHTRQETTLEDFIDDRLNMWDNDLQAPVIVTWDGSTLKKVATESCDEDGCTNTPIEPAQTITPEPFEWFSFWKPQGGGNFNIVADANGRISNSTIVPFYSEELVMPGDDSIGDGDMFYCVERCPKAGITEAEWQEGETGINLTFEDGSFQAPSLGDAVAYAFDEDTYALLLDGASVGLAEGASPSQGQNNWGAMSGAMVDTATLATMDDPWEVWDQETFVTWEMGPNEWNTVRLLLDSNGAAVAFDQPINFDYRDEAEGFYMLDFDGSNFNIPWERVDIEGSDFEMWVQKFRIPDGTALTSISDGTTYYVRALEVEQWMNETDSDSCGGLELGTIGAPTNEISEVDIGAKPTITDAPAVIGGDLQ